VFVSGLSGLRAIAVDEDGNVFALSNDRVRVYNSSGTFLGDFLVNSSSVSILVLGRRTGNTSKIYLLQDSDPRVAIYKMP
jgi:sugar lactone lactonase YvrE